MKASKPNISAPLSRKKKRNTTNLVAIGGSILVLILIVFGCLVFSAVDTNSSAAAKRLEQIPRGKPSVGETTVKKLTEEERPQRTKEDEERHLRHHPFDTHNEDGIAKETLVLHTPYGDLKIVLRPDYSPESAMYIKDVFEQGCDRCVFYRAEKPGIFQGMIKAETIAKVGTKGVCPPEFDGTKQACPKHDQKCACHGPTMTHG